MALERADSVIDGLRTLSSGFRLAFDDVPGLGVTALGFFVGVGSRDEQPHQWGHAHFLEHMLFKGAGPWSARQIAEQMDRLGGEINAFTTREYTCYYAKVLDPYATTAYRLLATMLKEPWLLTEEICRERQVIREELLENRDDPDAFTEALYDRAFFCDRALQHDILGSLTHLRRVTRGSLQAFFRQWYTPSRMVLAVSGGARDHVLSCAIADWDQARASDRIAPRSQPAIAPRQLVRRRPWEQVRIMIGYPAVSLTHPDYVAGLALAAIVGGQNSSRLWLKLREEHGLVYSVSTQYGAESDWGELTTMLALGPERVSQALSLYHAEMDALWTQGPRPDELARARTVLEANAVMALETPDSRVFRLGRYGLLGTTPPSIEQWQHRLLELSPERIQAVAKSWLSPSRLAGCAVGPLPRRPTQLWAWA